MVALSVDDKATTLELVEELGLEYPVLYGLDVEPEAQKIGAYYDPENGFSTPRDSYSITESYARPLTPVGRRVGWVPQT